MDLENTTIVARLEITPLIEHLIIGKALLVICGKALPAFD
jgi:hypothetical protein